jgi:hypothetical protein
MHPRTEATLEKLRNERWFRNVGVRDTDSADVLSSWQAAIESCSSLEWENLCLEAVNQYRARVIEKSPVRFEKWNDIVVAIKPVTQALVREKTASVVAEHDLPKVFLDTVDWDILNLCMEAEYADVYPPGFYASQAYWYLKGHFPCGWQGAFPKGKLVIY